MEPRRTGAAAATLFATTGTIFIGILIRDAGSRTLPAVAISIALGLLAWLGVLGWLHDRPVLALVGSWAAVLLNGFLWTLAALPLAVALVTTGTAVRRMWSRRRAATREA